MLSDRCERNTLGPKTLFGFDDATSSAQTANQDVFTECLCLVSPCRLVESGSGSIQSLSLSDSHLAELDGDTLRLFGLGALEALERGWGVQTAGAVTVITLRYINFDAIVPTLPRIRVKFPNLSVSKPAARPSQPDASLRRSNTTLDSQCNMINYRWCV